MTRNTDTHEEIKETTRDSNRSKDKNNNDNILSNVRVNRDQAEGYGILAAAILIFLYAAFGFLRPVFDFVIALAAVGLALYGAKKANLYRQIRRLWDYIQRKTGK